MSELSQPALRLLELVVSRLDQQQTNRCRLTTREALEGADLSPTYIASVQLELARSGLLWVNPSKKYTTYVWIPLEKRIRRHNLTHLRVKHNKNKYIKPVSG